MACRLPLILVVLGLSCLKSALAADLQVTSVGGPVVVVLDGKVLGTTPLSEADVVGGSHVVGFRSSMFGSTAFSETVLISADGTFSLAVDWSSRRVTLTEETTAQPSGPTTPPPMAELPVSIAPVEPTTQVGDLFVSANQAGARISVDGADTGQVTPVLLRGVAAVEHHVLLRTACAKTEIDIVVVPSVVTRIEATLQVGPGEIDVKTVPEGSIVRVDDVEVGTAPMLLPAQACGIHKMEIRAPGFIQATLQVDVVAFEIATVSAVLDPELYGKLTLLPTPIDAVVYLDGVEVGPGPRTIDPIAVGSHSVRAELAGFTPAVGVVDVTEGKITQLDLTLLPQPMRATPRWSRLALNTATGVSGLILGGLAISSFIEGREAYDRFLEAPSEIGAKKIWDEEVLPASRRAWMEGGCGGLVVATSVGLWITTDLHAAVGPGSILLEGTW